ncbi:MAG: hypothetical protein AAF456_16265 [Planctomycetota bacterium]
MQWLWMFCLVSAAFAGCSNDDNAAAMPQVSEELTEEQFEELHAEVIRPEELWLTIPWQTDLLAAQQIAVAEQKPIFIWAMDGHPLGCT